MPCSNVIGRFSDALGGPAGQRPRGVVHRPLVIDQVITAMLRQTMPDADVRVYDMTGTMDHLEVLVTSKAFEGVGPLDRHRMVEKALAPARADGRIHALQIRTATPEDTNA
jgi:stress-induced morphogen